MPSTSSGVTSGLLDGVDDPAVVHDADPVGQVEDVVDVVADQEDADALVLELADEVADLGRLGRAEGGRRLVHDQDPRVEVDRPGDGHRLALAAGEGLDRRAKRVKFGFRRPITLRVASSMAPSSSVPQPRRHLAAEEHVGRRIDVVGEGQRLVDRLDVVGLGVARVA